MKFSVFIYLTFGLLVVSCKSQMHEISNYSSDFIEMCVDSTLHLDPGTSTKTYLVDFGKVRVLSDTAIKQFLTSHTNASETNLDSLERNDTTWLKYGYFLNCVVKFNSIESHNDSVIVTMSKIRASDGSNGTKMIFKKTGSSYICLYSGITWIS